MSMTSIIPVRLSIFAASSAEHYLRISVFMSPLPNQKLWNGQTVGFLQTQECFANGGWWHDHRILEATGQGIEVEEPKAWHGWWNEQIVGLENDWERPRLTKQRSTLWDLASSRTTRWQFF